MKTKPVIDLTTRCALCGQPFPRTPPRFANMSGTWHSQRLPCSCETRRPPDPPKPERRIEDMTADEVAAHIREVFKNAPLGTIIDDDP